MHDRKTFLEIPRNKQPTIKITEAKHIQTLSRLDQELFVKLFYHKVKQILESTAFAEDFYGFPFDFFAYVFDQFNNTPEKQCNELMRKIKIIPTPTTDYLNQGEIHFYQKLQGSFHKISLLYEKKLLMPHSQAEILSKIVHIIYQNFFGNILQVRNLDHVKKYQVPKKCFKQLEELQDLYTFPSKYIDVLKKNHAPVYGYKKS